MLWPENLRYVAQKLLLRDRGTKHCSYEANISYVIKKTHLKFSLRHVQSLGITFCTKSFQIKQKRVPLKPEVCQMKLCCALCCPIILGQGKPAREPVVFNNNFQQTQLWFWVDNTPSKMTFR